MNVENVGQNPTNDRPWFSAGKRYIQLGLLTAGGANAGYTAIRIKEGALEEDGAGSFSLPRVGKRGAFVMEFQRPKQLRTFSLVVNDQPIFSGINLRAARFRSF
jgi:hypothetical protein